MLKLFYAYVEFRPNVYGRFLTTAYNEMEAHTNLWEHEKAKIDPQAFLVLEIRFVCLTDKPLHIHL